MKELLSSAARLLLMVPEDKKEITLAEARRNLGTTVYNAINKCISLNYVTYTEDKRIVLTEKGERIAKILKKCLEGLGES